MPRRVRIKTLQELLEAGYRAEGNDLYGPDQALIVPAMLSYGGDAVDAVPDHECSENGGIIVDSWRWEQDAYQEL